MAARETKIGFVTLYAEGDSMNIDLFMAGPPLMSLLAGVAILIWPRLLSYIVAFYLILFGILGLLSLVLV